MPDNINPERDEQELRELNEKIATHEMQGNDAAALFFRDTLAEDLIFRRASGLVVTKQQFLYDLKPDAFEILNPSVVDVQFYEDGAVVTVNIEAKRKGEEQKKQYLNIRRFVKRKGQWQLVAWLNTEIKA